MSKRSSGGAVTANSVTVATSRWLHQVAMLPPPAGAQYRSYAAETQTCGAGVGRRTWRFELAQRGSWR